MQARYAESTTMGRQTAPPPAAASKPSKAPRESKPKTSAQSQSKPQPKPIELTAQLPDARAVFIAGTFNNWDQNKTPMKRDGDGGWKTTLNLPPGRYEYKFVADGQWMCDPGSKECVQNDFGSSNSVLVV